MESINATDLLSIGSRIKKLRKEKGYEQKELAEILGVSREQVNYWENGKRDIKTEITVKLAQIFDVSTDYLLGLSEAKTNDKDKQFICDYTGLSPTAVEYLTIIFRILLVRQRDIADDFICSGEFSSLTYIMEQYITHYEFAMDGLKSCYDELTKKDLSEYTTKQINKIMKRYSVIMGLFDKVNLDLFKMQELPKDFIKKINKEKFKENNEEKEKMINFIKPMWHKYLSEKIDLELGDDNANNSET